MPPFSSATAGSLFLPTRPSFRCTTQFRLGTGSRQAPPHPYLWPTNVSLEGRSMLRFRGVLLDVDGTLINSNDAHAQAWVQALAREGYQVPFDRVRWLIGMGSD